LDISNLEYSEKNKDDMQTYVLERLAAQTIASRFLKDTTAMAIFRQLIDMAAASP